MIVDINIELLRLLEEIRHSSLIDTRDTLFSLHNDFHYFFNNSNIELEKLQNFLIKLDKSISMDKIKNKEFSFEDTIPLLTCELEYEVIPIYKDIIS